MKLRVLYELLNYRGSLEVIEKHLEQKNMSIFIFNIDIIHQYDNTTIIVDATSWADIREEAIKFIYSTLSDLEDIGCVEYINYDMDKDLYYFQVEFKDDPHIMGYGIMFETKEPYVCQITCEHDDCAVNKYFGKNAKCNTCEKRIYPGEKYYGSHLGELTHAICEKVNS